MLPRSATLNTWVRHCRALWVQRVQLMEMPVMEENRLELTALAPLDTADHAI
jgi:hypothetical protein